MTLRVEAIDTGESRAVSRFVQLPVRLHGRRAQWVPPWQPAERISLDRSRHPFFAHSEAAFFIARRGGDDLGRIAVLDNRHFNDYNHSRTALFCFLEAVDDAHVFGALFGAAASWAQARGLSAIAGPRGLLEIDAGGIMVEGFDETPSMGLAQSPPWYAARLADLGLAKDTDYLSGVFNRGHRFEPRFERIERRLRERGHIRVVTPRSRRHLRELADGVAVLYERAFTGQHAYYPRTAAEKEWMLREALGVVEPSFVKVAFAGEEPVGFLLAVPDLSTGLRRCGGRPWPLGWWHLQRARRTTRRALIPRVGVRPEYQGRGVNVLLYADIARSLEAAGFEQGEVQLVEEGNHASRADMEAAGVQWRKRHRTYRMAL